MLLLKQQLFVTQMPPNFNFSAKFSPVLTCTSLDLQITKSVLTAHTCIDYFL